MLKGHPKIKTEHHTYTHHMEREDKKTNKRITIIYITENKNHTQLEKSLLKYKIFVNYLKQGKHERKRKREREEKDVNRREQHSQEQLVQGSLLSRIQY